MSLADAIKIAWRILSDLRLSVERHKWLGDPTLPVNWSWRVGRRRFRLTGELKLEDVR